MTKRRRAPGGGALILTPTLSKPSQFQGRGVPARGNDLPPLEPGALRKARLFVSALPLQ